MLALAPATRVLPVRLKCAVTSQKSANAVKEGSTMAKTFASRLKDIVEEQQDELDRLKIENRLLRKASQEQRGINGALREENTILEQQLRLLTSH
jgi:hypothetical protein